MYDENVEDPPENCRCCTHPSPNFVKLSAKSKSAGTEGKSYEQLLQEITNRNINSNEEIKMPQKICRKCVKLLKNAYSFVVQAQQTYDYYLGMQVPDDGEELKDFEQLHETLIEIPKTPEDIRLTVKDECSNIVVETSSIKTDIFVKSPQVLEKNIKEEEQRDELSLNEDHFDAFLDERDQEDTPASDSYCEDDLESLENDELMGSNEPIARRCDVCHKVYRDERALNIHKRFTHMPEEEKMPCPLCSYKTSRSSALKVHMGLIHGPEKVEEHFKPIPITGKKFPCNLCERGYQRREDLRKHFRKKHKNPQLQKPTKRKEKIPKQKEEQCFLCACCGQSYTSKKALDGHLLSHTGERPYQCDICDKAFKRIKDMKAHRVIHSDEKPFQCSECGKSFKRADKLKIHMRVHSELRPYKCNECEKTFKYPSVLRTHMHMHTGQTPFACKTCGEAFSLRTSLNNHCLKNGHLK